MPRPSAAKSTLIIQIPELIFAIRANLKAVTSAEESSNILLDNIYRNIALHSESKKIMEGLSEKDLIRTLDGCRVPATGRIRFDFTINHAYGAEQSGDLASYALRYDHLGTATMLLSEERACWGAKATDVIRGSSRRLPNNTTWFHKLLILASHLYEKYKEDMTKQVELKECLHRLIQDISDVLDVHTPAEKARLIEDLYDYFLKTSSRFPCALALLRAISPGPAAAKLTQIDKIITDYDLTAETLLQRKTLLSRIQADAITKEEHNDTKEFLKTRYKLCILLLDRLFFEENIAFFSPIQVEALVETLMDLYISNDARTINYFLKSLTERQASTLCNYILKVMDVLQITAYLTRKKGGVTPEESEIVHLIRGVQNIFGAVLDFIGDKQQQLNYLYTAASERFAEAHTPENTLFLNNLSLYFCSYIYACRGLHTLVKNDAPIPSSLALELESVPSLRDKFSDRLPSFHEHILSALQKTETETSKEGDITQTCHHLWQAYLYSMWMEFNNIHCKGLPPIFPILDYFFEHIFKRPTSYPQLFAGLVGLMFSSHYFTNKKLEYLFKYRLGEQRAIAKKIELSELVRKSNGKSELITADFEDVLNLWKHTRSTEPLLAKIAETLTKKRESIYAQLDFAIAWVNWAKSREEAAAEQQSPFELMLHHLLGNTPFAEHIKRYALRVESKALDDNAVVGYLLVLVEDPSRLGTYDYSILIDNLVFDKSSARACLLLFLYILNIGKDANLIVFIEQILATISQQFDEDPAKQSAFAELYDEMAQHKFFKQRVGNALCRIIYRTYHIPLASTSTAEAFPEITIEANAGAGDEETEVVVAATSTKKKKHRKHKKAGAAASAPSAVVETDTVAETLTTPTTESMPPEKLYPVQQALLIATESLMALYTEKLTTAFINSFQAIHCREILTALQRISLILRKELEGIDVRTSLIDETTFAALPIVEQLQQYYALVAQLHELATDLPGELLKTVPSLEKMLQPSLHERIRLPAEMPLIKHLVALFARDAKLSIFGSALFFSDPLDIDLKLTWINPTVSLEVIKTIFKSSVESAGFKIIFSRDLIGEVSFTLQAKGDGYNLDNHKETDVLVQLADPKQRIHSLHHNSHCAASLDLSDGMVICSFDNAKKIIEGTFYLDHHPLAVPIERFKAKVHQLTSLMRAWQETSEGKMTLSASEQALIAQIAKHTGNWETLKAEDAELEAALHGMITRHFMNYQPSVTYIKRTELLFAFLKILGINSGIEQAVANATKYLLLNDLAAYEYGGVVLAKTDGFLSYCREAAIPLDSTLFKETFTKVLQAHFSHYNADPVYLAKTSLLFYFFQNYGFRIMAKIGPSDKPQQCELLGINSLTRLTYFSLPQAAIDSPQILLFQPNHIVLDIIHQTIVQAEKAAQLIEEMKSHPPLTTAWPLFFYTLGIRPPVYVPSVGAASPSPIIPEEEQNESGFFSTPKP